MNFRFALRLTMLLVCFSFAVFGGSIALYNRPFTTTLGDVAVNQTSYTDMQYTTHTPYGTNPDMIVVGGNIDASTAAWMTDTAILDMAAFVANGNSCLDSLGVNTACGSNQIAALGLLTSDLNQFLAADQSITNGSAIVWSGVNVGNNDVFDFGTNFVANDNLPYNDFAFLALVGGATPYVYLVNSVQTVGDYGSSGWSGHFQFTGTSGQYDVVYGVVNVGAFNYAVGTATTPTMFNFDPLDPAYDDNIPPATFDSALLLGPVPEPTTMFLAGSALLLLGGFARRMKK